MAYRIWYIVYGIPPYIGYIGYMGVMGHDRFDGFGGDVETLALCDDKSVHGSEAKSVMISVHGCERLCDEVRMKE